MPPAPVHKHSEPPARKDKVGGAGRSDPPLQPEPRPLSVQGLPKRELGSRPDATTTRQVGTGTSRHPLRHPRSVTSTRRAVHLGPSRLGGSSEDHPGPGWCGNPELSASPGKFARVTSSNTPRFTFADLFAGIGGFHAALHAAGGEGWFASEIDSLATRVYEQNWSLKPHGDIVKLTEPDVRVPPTDVLAGGFPCQPFSKSGFQRGMDEVRGTLFFNICRVLQEHRPPVILLENVRNLAGPRQRETWLTIVETLRDLGYRVPSEPAVMSPHLLPPWLGGRPQVRERVFILGTYVGPHLSRTPEALAVQPIAVNKPVDGWDPHKWDLDEHLLQPDAEIEEPERYRLNDAEVLAIDLWDEFVRTIPMATLPGFPVWADEFREVPRIDASTPPWKATFLHRNSELYLAHQDRIDAWRCGTSPETATRLLALTPSRRKLEWQAGQPVGQDRSLWDTVMHFRPSGIRAKRPSYLPALVAITQTSIIGKRRRRITPLEAARLQGLPDWFEFRWPGGEKNPEGMRQPDPATYKQLGNGVNAGAAYWVFREHVRRDADLIRRVAPHLVDAVLAAPANLDENLVEKPVRKPRVLDGTAIDLNDLDGARA